MDIKDSIKKIMELDADYKVSVVGRKNANHDYLGLVKQGERRMIPAHQIDTSLFRPADYMSWAEWEKTVPRILRALEKNQKEAEAEKKNGDRKKYKTSK